MEVVHVAGAIFILIEKELYLPVDMHVYVRSGQPNNLLLRTLIITSHHMVKTDAGLIGLYIREITIYIRLYYYINS